MKIYVYLFIFSSLYKCGTRSVGDRLVDLEIETNEEVCGSNRGSLDTVRYCKSILCLRCGG